MYTERGSATRSTCLLMAAVKRTTPNMELLHKFAMQNQRDAEEDRKQAAVYIDPAPLRAAVDAAFARENRGDYTDRADGTTGGVDAWVERAMRNVGYVPGQPRVVSTGYHWVANRGWYKN